MSDTPGLDQARILKAERKDLPTLNTISKAAKAFWGYPEAWLKAWEPDLRISEEDLREHEVYKLVENGEILGFCVIVSASDYYEVDHLWVRPDRIGKGYGKLLLKESMRQAIPSKSRVVVLADPNAEAFYVRQGFTTIEQVETYPPGRYLPKMERYL